jgi:Tol biopolymer transport system component
MKQITVHAIAAALIAATAGVATAKQCLFSTIAFSSTRDDPAGPPLLTAEIYLMNPDGSNQRRVTENVVGDGFPKFSPDGKRILFESNRDRLVTEPLNTFDLFLMKPDGTDQTLLTRGSSATWSPDGKYIAFHRSASGDVCPFPVLPPVPPRYHRNPRVPDQDRSGRCDVGQ